MSTSNPYELGQQFAKRIRIGKRFFGSVPIAHRLYGVGALNYHMFISGFNSVLGDYEIWIRPDTNLISDFKFKSKG